MRRFSWLILVLLAVVACAPTSKQSAVLPLTEIPGGSQGPVVEHQSNQSVVIKFYTAVPTACNVTYGTDAEYGSIATDMMMSGAINEHDITLLNLEPNTTYHYRLNLTDEAGNLYQSDDLTFTTEESNTSSSDQTATNIASLAAGAKVIGVSSNYGSGDNDSNFGANNAIDGSSSTQWSSNGDGDNAWIEIELPAEYNIDEVGFWTRTMSNNTATIFSFTVTADGGETYGPFELPDTTQLYTFPVSFTAKVLRFDAVTTNTGNTGAVEISVYGTRITD